MAPALTHADVSDADPADPGPSRRRNVIVGCGIACFLAMGIFWLLILSGWFNTTSPDHLADRAWVKRAEQRCTTMQNEIDALPKAQTAKTPADRAVLINRGSAYVTTLVEQLNADHPATPEEQRLVDAWLADWRVYLGDRSSYAQRVQQDPAAKSYFTQRHGESVTDAIENFATVNAMPDCSTPQDL